MESAIAARESAIIKWAKPLGVDDGMVEIRLRAKVKNCWQTPAVDFMMDFKLEFAAGHESASGCAPRADRMRTPELGRLRSFASS